MDSARNCLTSEYLPAPITLRTPTSLARLDARAVDRFMKLMQAITWIRIAIRIMMFRKEPLTVLLGFLFISAGRVDGAKGLQMQLFFHPHLLHLVAAIFN